MALPTVTDDRESGRADVKAIAGAARDSGRNRRRAALFYLASVPATVVILLYAAGLARTDPIFDAWSWIVLLGVYKHDGLGLLDLLTFRLNEHPYGLPTAAFIYLGQWFDYRFDVVALAGASMTSVAMLLTLRVGRRAGADTPLAALLASLAFCSLRQDETLLSGFAIGLSQTTLLAVAGVLCATAVSRSEGRVAAAAYGVGLLAILGMACLSSAAAFALFLPVVFILLSGARSLVARLTTATVIVLLCAFAVFFVWQQQHGSAALSIPVSWDERLRGFFLLVGGAMFEERSLAFVSAPLILLAFGLGARTGLRSGPYGRALVMIGVIALIDVALIAWGRGDATNPGRYATYSVPLVATTVLLLFAHSKQARAQYKQGIRSAILGAVLAAYGMSGYDGIIRGLYFHDREAEAAIILSRVPELTTADLQMEQSLVASVSLIRQQAAFMQAYSINIFSDPASLYQANRSRQPITNFLDNVNASFETSPTGETTMKGDGFISTRRLLCPGSEPCPARIDAEIISAGDANMGLIFRDVKGQVVGNQPFLITGKAKSVETFEAEGPKGSATVEGYIYAPSPQSQVRFRNLGLTVEKPVVAPKRCNRFVCLPWLG